MVQDKIIKSVIFMLMHLKSVPLDEVHANIDAMIDSLKRTEEEWTEFTVVGGPGSFHEMLDKMEERVKKLES